MIGFAFVLGDMVFFILGFGVGGLVFGYIAPPPHKTPPIPNLTIPPSYSIIQGQ